MDHCIGFISLCFLDKIITGNNENNGSYFVETLYNSGCSATTELHLIIEVRLYPVPGPVQL